MPNSSTAQAAVPYQRISWPAARTLTIEIPIATRIQETTTSPVVRSFSSNRCGSRRISVAGLGPGLQLPDPRPAALARRRRGRPGGRRGCSRRGTSARRSRSRCSPRGRCEPADEVVLQLVDGVDLRRAGVVAGPAADAGVLDVDGRCDSFDEIRGRDVDLAFMNSWRLPLNRKNMSRSRGSSAHSRMGTPGRLNRLRSVRGPAARRLRRCSRAYPSRPSVRLEDEVRLHPLLLGDLVTPRSSSRARRWSGSGGRCPARPHRRRSRRRSSLFRRHARGRCGSPPSARPDG